MKLIKSSHVKYLDGKNPSKKFLKFTNKVRKEIVPWLPKKIIDFHVHLGVKQHVGKISNQRKKLMSLNYASSMTGEKLTKSYKILFPEKSILPVPFPFPFREIFISFANKYICKFNPCIILGDLKNPEATNKLLKKDNVVGLKVYYDFINKPQNEIRLREMINDKWLKKLNEEGKILILHIQGKSLLDKKHSNYINKTLKRYPNIKLVLAHLARLQRKKDFIKGFKNLNKKILPKVYWETSTVTDKEVYIECLKRIDINNILFGSDLPYGLKKGKIFYLKEYKSFPLITEDKYIWTLPRYRKWYLNNKPSLTFMIYHQILGIKTACDKLNIGKKGINKIFYSNAKRLLKNKQKLL